MPAARFVHISGGTVLCVDYRQNGLGSTSCGTVLLPQYRFDATAFRLAVQLNIG